MRIWSGGEFLLMLTTRTRGRSVVARLPRDGHKSPETDTVSVKQWIDYCIKKRVYKPTLVLEQISRICSFALVRALEVSWTARVPD